MGYILIQMNKIYSLTNIFIAMACLSLLMLVKSLTLHPVGDTPDLPNGICVFRYSIVGRMFRKIRRSRLPKDTVSNTVITPSENVS